MNICADSISLKPKKKRKLNQDQGPNQRPNGLSKILKYNYIPKI